MTPFATTGPAPYGTGFALDRSRVALGRALNAYLLQRIPDDYAYSSGALNKLVVALLDTVDAALAVHFAAMDEEGDE